MTPTYRAEVWNLPDIAATRMLGRLRYGALSWQDELSDVGYGRISFVGESVSDIGRIIDTENDFGTMVRVYDDADNHVGAFFAENLDQDYQSKGGSVLHGPGVGNILDKMLVYPKNGLDGDNPDWIWGGPSRLPALTYKDLGHINAEWEIYLGYETYSLMINATGGNFVLSIGGDDTDPLSWNASPGTIQSELEALPGITNVFVLDHEDGSMNIIFLRPGTLPTDLTIDDSGLTGGAASADFSKVNDGFDETANPTFTITVVNDLGSETTIAMAYDVNPTLMSNLIEDLANVDDVSISGGEDFGGHRGDPWVLTFYAPPTVTDLQVTFAAGSEVVTETEEGRPDPSPITQSQRADRRPDPTNHGTYTTPELQVITTPALLNGDSDWTLLVNATGRYAGSQILISVSPGQTYQASIAVRPTVTGRYRIVVRDRYENLIKWFHTEIPANVYTTLELSDIVIPSGVDEVIFRVAVVDAEPARWKDHYTDWAGATFYEGEPPTTAGNVIRTFVDAAQTRGTGGWLHVASFGALDDSDAVPWVEDELSITVPAGQTILQVLDALVEEAGIQWHVQWVDALDAYSLRVWNDANAGVDRSATLTFHPRAGWEMAAYQESTPPYTVALGEGEGPIWAEQVHTGMVAGYGRWEGSLEMSNIGIHQSPTLQQWLARHMTAIKGARFAIRATTKATLRYGVDFRVGDKVNYAFSNTPIGKKTERLASVMLSVEGGEPQGAMISADFVKPVLIEKFGGTTSAPTSYILNKFLRRFNRKVRVPRARAGLLGEGGSDLTITVASAEASLTSRQKADFIGDGVDDTEMLRQALEAAAGGRVVLSEGTFALDGEIVMPGNTFLVGASHETNLYMSMNTVVTIGAGGGIKDMRLSFDEAFVGTAPIAIEMGIDSIIENVYSDDANHREGYVNLNTGCRINGWTQYAGSAPYDTPDGAFFHGVGVSDFSISNVRIIGADSDGPVMRFTSCNYVMIENIHLTGAINELWLDNCDQVSIDRWHSLGGGSNAYPAWRFLNSAGISMTSCKLIGPTINGSGGILSTLAFLQIDNCVAVHIGRDNLFADGFGGNGDSGCYILLEDSARCTIGPSFGGLGTQAPAKTQLDLLRLVNSDNNYIALGSYQPYGLGGAGGKPRHGILIDSTSDENLVWGNFFGDDLTRWLDDPISDGSSSTVVGENFVPGTSVSSGTPSSLIASSQTGALSVASGTFKLPFPVDATILSVKIAVGTAPTGSSIIVDVHKNGTTIFTTQANRPTIAAAATVSANATPDVTAIAAGEYLTVDIDQVGSTTPGDDLVVVVQWEEA